MSHPDGKAREGDMVLAGRRAREGDAPGHVRFRK